MRIGIRNCRTIRNGEYAYTQSGWAGFEQTEDAGAAMRSPILKAHPHPPPLAIVHYLSTT